MMYLVLLILLSYLVFIFVAEDFNPVFITKNPMKRARWRLGRAASLATIVAGVCTLILMRPLALSTSLAAFCFFCLTLILWLPGLIKYKKIKCGINSTDGIGRGCGYSDLQKNQAAEAA